MINVIIFCCFYFCSVHLVIDKIGNVHYLAIEVAHVLQRYMTTVIHGNYFLIRNWMKTPVEETQNIKSVDINIIHTNVICSMCNFLK